MGLRPPPASSETARATMRANRSADTAPELSLRSELHRRGLRFRKNLRIPVEGGSTRPDIVFTRARIAVFVDGCFWHSCPEHGALPQANRDFWSAKFERNVQRDRANDAALSEAGWLVLRFFEHVPAADAALAVQRAVTARRREVRPQGAAPP